MESKRNSINNKENHANKFVGISKDHMRKKIILIIFLSFIVGALVGMGFYAHLQNQENNAVFEIAMCCIEELYNVSVYGGC